MPWTAKLRYRRASSSWLRENLWVIDSNDNSDYTRACDSTDGGGICACCLQGLAIIITIVRELACAFSPSSPFPDLGSRQFDHAVHHIGTAIGICNFLMDVENGLRSRCPRIPLPHDVVTVNEITQGGLTFASERAREGTHQAANMIAAHLSQVLVVVKHGSCVVFFPDCQLQRGVGGGKRGEFLQTCRRLPW